MKKKYSMPEEQEQPIVNEPTVAYTSNTQQAQEPIISNSSTRPPCQYTEEEIIENFERAIQDYKMGKGTPHEQIRRKTL